jgi:hypothetical protein
MSLARQSNIVNLGIELNKFFDGKDIDLDEWLNSYVPALEDKPSELMSTKNGREQLILCLNAMKHGDIWTIDN